VIGNEALRGEDTFPIAGTWIAMGDSYSAGVGAGNLLDNPWDPDKNCLTTDGSYPKQLEKSYPNLAQGLEFLSCTGDVIANVNGYGSHGRESQRKLLSGLDPYYKLGTLSIGGNDLGFSDIVKRCIILGVGDCEAALRKAESIAGINPRDSASHFNTFVNLKRVYEDILDTAPAEFTLMVTGYARFFAEPQGNPDCNNGQIQLASTQDLGLPTRPYLPLTENLRTRINRGVDFFNAMIERAVSQTQDRYATRPGGKRVIFVDINPTFEGHRFCETGSSKDSGWPEFTDNAWFFSSPFRHDIKPDGQRVAPRADDGSPKLQLDRRDSAFCDDPHNDWDCVLGELLEKDPDMPLNEKEYPRGMTLSRSVVETTKAMVMKAFHPKSIAYEAIARKIHERYREVVFGSDE
jgi:hypothetical protein